MKHGETRKLEFSSRPNPADEAVTAAAQRRPLSAADLDALAAQIRAWGGGPGLSAGRHCRLRTGKAEARLMEWLGARLAWRHGLHVGARHAPRPPGGTGAGNLAGDHGAHELLSAECARFLGGHATTATRPMLRATPSGATITRSCAAGCRSSATGSTEAVTGRQFSYRVFTDSAPVMEVELAAKSGLGWRGKHTLLLNREAGSWFFLGEIYTDLPLPVDTPQSDHCGTCSRCIDVCPTQAIVAPYQLDARRCISYLTIETQGRYSGGTAPAHRQPGLRLRRLPTGLPVEPICPEGRHGGLRSAQRP